MTQDSQTITADYVQVRREDVEIMLNGWRFDIAVYRRRNDAIPEVTAFDRLTAALNQGQG